MSTCALARAETLGLHDLQILHYLGAERAATSLFSGEP